MMGHRPGHMRNGGPGPGPGPGPNFGGNMQNQINQQVRKKTYSVIDYVNQGLVKGAELCLNPYFFGWLEK